MTDKKQPKLAEMVHESGTVAYAKGRIEAIRIMRDHDGRAFNVVRDRENGGYLATRSERRIDAPNGPGAHGAFAKGKTREDCAAAIIQEVSKGWRVPVWERERAAQRSAGWKDKQAREWDRIVGKGRER